MPSANAPAVASIESLGDGALLLRLGETIDATSNRRVHAIAAALQAQKPDWLIELTPAYASLAVHVDVTALHGDDPLASVRDWLTQWLAHARIDTASAIAQSIEIPVLYGGDAGPDFDALAVHANLRATELIDLHAGGDYTVAMLGFAPGFPYLLGLDPRLHAPRHPTPRARVAAGSVGIGGAQTGIYPFAGPGGWQLIGRTPLRLFAASRDSPSLLRPGDRVRFVAIDAARFAALDEHSR
ncbi:MAG: 5-oxoprolinase subunit PxpB [Proteobacteria bacterium]|nr:5-oxoprolinase subunit PxpB [Pseudomonadota bacterium]